MTAILHNRLAAFLLNLECLDMAGQRDAVINEVIETGGTYCPPPPEGSDAWASHLYEIQLHGIAGYGHSEAEAVTSWKKAARAACPLPGGNRPPPVPFPSPRNHAEEIANTLADPG
ncbi:MAG TPA: hypothetical protein DIT40_08905 [Alphaproteobacteria bacterium]|nr:hypothetical protein [Alphaproteobacteria bacterium]